METPVLRLWTLGNCNNPASYEPRDVLGDKPGRVVADMEAAAFRPRSRE